MKTFRLCILLFLLTVASYAQNKKIVFVCEHGAAKSVIAAAYFNKIAKEKKLPWEAVCRGTAPDEQISERTKTLLTSDNLFDPKLKPQKLSQEDVDQADQVILFFPLPESIQSKNNIINWPGIDAVNNDFLKLRDDIISKLTPLIDSLAKQ
jgi:arsenate reductase (thioredoxin)